MSVDKHDFKILGGLPKSKLMTALFGGKPINFTVQAEEWEKEMKERKACEVILTSASRDDKALESWELNGYLVEEPYRKFWARYQWKKRTGSINIYDSYREISWD